MRTGQRRGLVKDEDWSKRTGQRRGLVKEDWSKTRNGQSGLVKDEEWSTQEIQDQIKIRVQSDDKSSSAARIRKMTRAAAPLGSER